jgi:hypothetical protein
MNRALWSYRITVTPKDIQRLRIFVREEIHYHNALVAGLTGPVRSMPDVFRDLTGIYERIYAEVAAYAVDLTQAKSLPASLESLRDAIYDKDGKIILPSKMMIILDVAKTPANLHNEARRNMALSFLNAAKDQSSAFHNTLSDTNRLGQVYKYASETFQAVDAQTKRHVQLPSTAMRATESGRNLILKFPYMVDEFTIPLPQIKWNKIYMRELTRPDGMSSGTVMLEFASDTAYDHRRTDALPFTRKKVRKDRAKV